MSNPTMLRSRYALAVASIWVVAVAACQEKPDLGTPRPPSQEPVATPSNEPVALAAPQGQLPPGHPPVRTKNAQPKLKPAPFTNLDTTGVELTDQTLELDGIVLTVPKGWVREKVAGGGAFAASRKAQFRLPKTDNDTEDAAIVITHFPGMRGMDEQNIRRWYSQVAQPDNSPTVTRSFRADWSQNGVSVSLVDIPGILRSGGPMAGGAVLKNGRLLAAILKHDNGPHFFKLTGPSDTVKHWTPSVVAFLKSAKKKQP